MSVRERDASGAVLDVVTRAGGTALHGLLDVVGGGRAWTRDTLPDELLTANPRLAVRDLLVRNPELEDYDISGALDLTNSTARGVQLDTATVAASLSGGTLNVPRLQLAGPDVDAEGSGTVELAPDRSSRFDYHIIRADLSLLREVAGRDLAGQVRTIGALTGPAPLWREPGLRWAEESSAGSSPRLHEGASQ